MGRHGLVPGRPLFVLTYSVPSEVPRRRSRTPSSPTASRAPSHRPRRSRTTRTWPWRAPKLDVSSVTHLNYRVRHDL